uniref:Unplaced genomic scaffold supercont1.19, whole genome shotgun sequence n=1 Tax=Cryptococcus bacillisporus CA1280 TaxID=1296109 RepID=A0A0D0VBY6_CRYGA|nr:hypothetical protein I312_05616 [Cryptococcus bacillisporus CA1280]
MPLSTSQFANFAEQSARIIERIKATHTTLFATFNAATGTSNGNAQCRKCVVYGMIADRISGDGICDLHEAHELCTKEKTIKAIEEQCLAAFRGEFTHAEAIATTEGVKDTVHKTWLPLIKSKMAELKGQDGLLDQDTLLKQMQSWFDEQPRLDPN